MQERAVNWTVTHLRKTKSGDVNVGKVAGDILKLFAGDQADWAHGKELLAGIGTERKESQTSSRLLSYQSI